MICPVDSATHRLNNWGQSVNFIIFWKQRGRSLRNRELKQPRRRRQQKPDKFAYLTMKNSIFARFPRAFFIFWHFEDVLVLSTTSNDLFCSCVDDVGTWWQMFNLVFLCPKRWFQFNSRIVRTHFSNIMTLNNWKMIAERRSDIFRWRSRFRRRRGCLSSLMTTATATLTPQTNDLIGWMGKSNRAARAARFLVQFFGVVCQMRARNFHFELLTTTGARSIKCLILCLYLITIRGEKAKVHLAYFVQHN